MIARILTPWTGDGLTLATANRPQINDDHPLPLGASCSDATGQPAENLPCDVGHLIVEVRGVTQYWLDAVAADPVYTVLYVDEERADKPGPEPELDDDGKPLPVVLPELVAESSEVIRDMEYDTISAKFVELGVKPVDLDVALGGKGRDRRAVADDLAGWLRERPRAK